MVNDILIFVMPTLCLLAGWWTMGVPVARAASAPARPVNITGILDRGGQFTTFIRLLTSTQMMSQLQIQINNSGSGITLFSPTDFAFQSLKPGTLNAITDQQKVALVLYHVLPSFYLMSQFQTLSNPLRTLASGNGGKPFGLNVTSYGNQVNVSSGVVNTQISNSLYSESPVAVYQVDMVLLPEDIFGSVKSPGAPPPLAAAVEEGVPKPSGVSGGGAERATATTSSGFSAKGGSGMFVQALLSIVMSCFLGLFLL